MLLKLLFWLDGKIKQNLRGLVKLTPLPEQKAIAHILGKLDEKIELKRHKKLSKIYHALRAEVISNK